MKYIRQQDNVVNLERCMYRLIYTFMEVMNGMKFLENKLNM